MSTCKNQAWTAIAATGCTGSGKGKAMLSHAHVETPSPLTHVYPLTQATYPCTRSCTDTGSHWELLRV